MRGRPPRSISFLKDSNNNSFTYHIDVANKLANSFASISSCENSSNAFNQIRLTEENKQLDFTTAIQIEYNQPFTMIELTAALSSSSITSPGPDQIHYKMLKYLHENAPSYLLRIFNRLWSSLYYPSEWQIANIVPIPKPGKDHTDPSNYRPIALTSCLGKIMEKLINRRLIEYMENNKYFSPFQCGFRKNRGTIDHLTRLDLSLIHI